MSVSVVVEEIARISPADETNPTARTLRESAGDIQGVRNAHAIPQFKAARFVYFARHDEMPTWRGVSVLRIGNPENGEQEHDSRK